METGANNQSALQHSEANKKKERSPFGLFSTNWGLGIVDNKEASALYSRKAIFFFTLFFSVLFGGVLQFLNMVKLRNKQGQLVVAVYTVLYGIISTMVLLHLKRSTSLTLFINLLGSYPLYIYIWRKYIGDYTEYRPRNIWIPLVIGLGIMAIFVRELVIHPELIK